MARNPRHALVVVCGRCVATALPRCAEEPQERPPRTAIQLQLAANRGFGTSVWFDVLSMLLAPVAPGAEPPWDVPIDGSESLNRNAQYVFDGNGG